jgi:hypothetical protein
MRRMVRPGLATISIVMLAPLTAASSEECLSEREEIWTATARAVMKVHLRVTSSPTPSFCLLTGPWHTPVPAPEHLVRRVEEHHRRLAIGFTCDDSAVRVWLSEPSCQGRKAAMVSTDPRVYYDKAGGNCPYLVRKRFLRGWKAVQEPCFFE